MPLEVGSIKQLTHDKFEVEIRKYDVLSQLDGTSSYITVVASNEHDAKRRAFDKYRKKEIKCIEVLNKDVYIEYSNGYDNDDSAYVSFHKARAIIKGSCKELIEYSYTKSQKALDFINSIPYRGTIFKGNKSYLKLKKKKVK